MCRLAVYRGKQISLNDLILKPHHNLYKQAWQPKETSYAMLNADGFGFGWYDDRNKACVYRNPIPIWSDVNLKTLSHALHAKLWFAMVRSATVANGFSHHNLQPFVYKHYMFMHNGFIRDFRQGVLQKILALLPESILASIHGLTDSAYLFGLLCFFLEQAQNKNSNSDEVLESALLETLNWCHQYLPDHHAMLNMVITDGNKLVAVRAGINEEPPTLYFAGTAQTHLPVNAQILSSEPFSNNDDWELLQANQLIVLDPAGQHRFPT